MQRKTTDPIARLMQEHDSTLRQLRKLNSAIDGLESDGFVKRHFAQVISSLSFIDEEVNQHNRREEDALFPILERYVEGPTRLMRHDHKELHRNFESLRRAVERVEKQREDCRAIASLVEVSRTLVQIFVNHIHKENYILFPIVKKFLSKAELREVAKKMI